MSHLIIGGAEVLGVILLGMLFVIVLFTLLGVATTTKQDCRDLLKPHDTEEYKAAHAKTMAGQLEEFSKSIDALKHAIDVAYVQPALRWLAKR